MARIYTRIGKDGRKIWYLQFWDETGHNRTRSLGKINKRQAAIKLHAFEAEGIKAIDPSQDPDNNTISLSEYFTQYIEYSQNYKAVKTANMDSDIISGFVEFTGDIKLADVTRACVETYQQERLKTLSPVSMNIEFRHLRAFFNKAIELDYLVESPMRKMQQFKVPEKETPRFLESHQVQKLREAFRGDPLAPMVDFLLFTGARRGETVSLMGDDIDLRNGVIHFRGSKTKSKKNRMIRFKQFPALDKLIRSLEPRRGKPVFCSAKYPDKPWDQDYVGQHISKVLTSIGMPWASTHTLRHTFASNLVQQGVPIWTVSQLLGHSSVTVTEKYYAHLAPSVAEQAISKLSYAVLTDDTESLPD